LACERSSSMLGLSLLWLLLGSLLSALALGARLQPAYWGPRGWLVLLGIGAAAGVLGGWIGALVLGRLNGTATALWVAALAVVAAPWLTTRLRQRMAPTVPRQAASEDPGAEEEKRQASA